MGPLRGPSGPRLLGVLLLLALLVALTPSLQAAPDPGPVPTGRDEAEAEAGRRLYLPILSPQLGRVEPPRFGLPAGFYDAPASLTLRSDTPGSLVRYTTDGRAPTEAHGRIYSSPILLTETTILRAVAFRPGMLPSETRSASFIFRSTALAQPERPEASRFPDFWGHYSEEYLTGNKVPPDYGMDPLVTLDPRGAGRLAADLLALPSLSLIMDPVDLFGSPPEFGDLPGLYSHPLEQGSDWERPVSLEIFEPGGGLGLQADAGIRIAGGWSRKPDVTPKHSFSLRFRSRYGPSRLRYPLFPGSPVDSFDTLRLRAGQADSLLYLPRSLYVHDEWGRRSQLAMGGPAARGSFVHLYLNGLYWGLYNLAEEPTAAFAEEHLGGAEEEWDVIKGRQIIEMQHGKPVIFPSWEIEDGDAAAWEALLAIPRQGPATDPALRARLEALLDLDAHIDYTLLQIYAGNDDWLGKNWRALRRRLPGERWRVLVWDLERSVFLRALDPRCGDGRDFGKDCDVWQKGSRRVKQVGDISRTEGVMGLHGWLSDSPDYRLRLADRARRLFYEQGLLTPGAVRARYTDLLTKVEPGIEPESARWGDAYPRPRTRNENFTPWSLFWDRTPDRRIRRDPHWLEERARLLDQAIPARTEIVLGQLCRAGLLPPVAPLRASLDGLLESEAGARLSIELLDGGCSGAHREGVILYSLDGSDPRQANSSPAGTWWTGSIAAGAREYRQPLRVDGYLRLRARLAVPTGEGLLWGPELVLTAGRPRLSVSEILYHPEGGSSEFLELRSLEPAPIDLSGARFEGIALTLPHGTVIPAQGHLVVARDAAAFGAQHPDVPLAAEYFGALSNGGERIRLLDARGHELIDLRYDDEGFWPRGADLLGHSLVPREAGSGDASDPEAWRESARIGGSPGAEDPPPPWPRLLLNEVLANSDAPYEDAVEIFNPGLAPADLSGWWLSDDPRQLDELRLPAGTIVPPGGHVVVYEQSLRAGGQGGFALSSAGESLLLTAVGPGDRPLGSIRGLDFGPSATNVSLGRHVNGQGLLELVPQTRPSFGVEAPADLAEFRQGGGAANLGPRIGPLLISELMLAPPAGEPEWIELHNRSDSTVHLFDPADRNRRWAFTEGVDFRFPAGAFIPAGGRALVVGGDPVAFRAARNLPREVPVFGPFSGRLDGSGERLALSMPFERDADDGSPLWVELEWLRWQDQRPWPGLAFGGGATLERLEPPAYANDPASWSGLRRGGTPGLANSRPVRLQLPWLQR